MLNCLCRPVPAGPSHSAAVKERVTASHAAVVSISGIAPLCTSNKNGSRRDPGAKATDYASTDGKGFCDAASATIRGLGILIHPALVLTTNSTIASPLCIEDAEITFCRDVTTLTYVKRRFLPYIMRAWTIDRFFATSVELDLTVVSCEIVAEDPTYSLPLDTTKLHHGAICRGHPIFIMGCQMRRPDDIVISKGYITGVMAGNVQSNAWLFFQTVGDGIWMPGTAGFDEFGSFSFIVTRPPGKVLGGMQSNLLDFSTENIGGGRSIPSLNRLISGNLYAHNPSHLAIRLQAIKEWLVAMGILNRTEILEGTIQAWKTVKPTRRPYTQGDALFRQKSFTPRSVILTTDDASLNKKLYGPSKNVLAIAQEQAPSCQNKQGVAAEEAPLAWDQPVGQGLEVNLKTVAPSSCVEEKRAEKAWGTASSEIHCSLAQQPKKLLYKEPIVLNFNTKAKIEAPLSCAGGRLAWMPASIETHSSSAYQLDNQLPKMIRPHNECPIQNTFSSAVAKKKSSKISAKAAKYKTAAKLGNVSVKRVTPAGTEEGLLGQIKYPRSEVTMHNMTSEGASKARLSLGEKKANSIKEHRKLEGGIRPVLSMADRELACAKGSRPLGVKKAEKYLHQIIERDPDPAVKDADIRLSCVSNGLNSSGYCQIGHMPPQRPGLPPWIDDYYSLGRSHSKFHYRSSCPGR